MEYLLFTCPHCRFLDILFSTNNQLSCGQCQYSVIYNEYGFLEELLGELRFDNLRDWNQWQNQFLKEFIAAQYNFKQGN